MRYTLDIEQVQTFNVSTVAAGRRLDLFLCLQFPDYSRNYLQRLIGDNLVLIDGRGSKSSQRVKIGEQIEVKIPQPITLDAVAENIPLAVIYEDSDLLVVNKPARMIVHAAPGHERGTLVNALLYHCRDLSGIGGAIRPGIIHRLDMDTTGCIVCAKSDMAHRKISEQFVERTVEKRYTAITHGVPTPPEGKVEGYIRRPEKFALHRIFSPHDNGGKYSLTFYRTLKNYQHYALVECTIKTGRTHQIRLHLASRGAPVLCDATYGKESVITANMLLREKINSDEIPILTRQALHASFIGFDHPITKRRLQFTAPLPADMQNVSAILGKSLCN